MIVLGDKVAYPERGLVGRVIGFYPPMDRVEVKSDKTGATWLVRRVTLIKKGEPENE